MWKARDVWALALALGQGRQSGKGCAWVRGLSFSGVATSFLLPESLLLATLLPPPPQQLRGADEA